VGETVKLAPLAEDPIDVPPVGVVYQLIELPAEMATKLELCPQVIVAGVAVTGVGAGGNPMVTVTATLPLPTQPDAIQLKLISPLPERVPAVLVPPVTPPM
jgi:hypothetical protein